MLEKWPEVFGRVMHTYAERWAYRHPGTDDFLAVASEVSGLVRSARCSAAPPDWTMR